MKLYLLLICCFTVTILSVSDLSAMDRKYGRQKLSNGFILNKAEVNLRPTPRYRVDNYKSSASNYSTNARWLEISLNYMPPRLTSSKKATKGRGSNGYRWLDDVTMEVRVLFQAYVGTRKVMAEASGTVNYWSIKMDGAQHYAIMLLHPQILERYGLKRAYKKDDFLAMISFYSDHKSKLLFRTYATHRKYSQKQIQEIFKRYSGRLKPAGYIDLGDVILPRNKTPWAFVQYDKYDMINPESDSRR